ncbi:MAG: hypothetical protein HYY50_01035 [Candidatus Kerfeldbacteria bacterium]|nr:hypothetical protein [Candidatus Kerfeldbacteria bacterium]
MKRMYLAVLLGLLVPTLTLAVPLQIPYSGQLSENGQLVNGTRDLTINIYADSVGGSPVYAETFAGATVQNGIYHLNLNPDQSVWDGSVRWLGISVNGGAELTPRTKVGTVPYAVRAGVASHADALTNPAIAPGLNWMVNTTTILTITQTQWTAVDSISINCPEDGYVMVHTGGLCWLTDAGCLNLILTDNPPNLNGDFHTAVTGPGVTYVPLAMTGSYQVNAGPRTFYLMASLFCPTGTVKITYRSMFAMWFPNRYQ